MFLTEDEGRQQVKQQSLEKTTSPRSCSTVSTHSSGEIMSEDGSSPTALMKALIRDLAFETTIPTTMPFPGPQSQQRSGRASSREESFSSIHSSSKNYGNEYYSINNRTAQRENNSRPSKATIDSHCAADRSSDGGWGRRPQTVWKSAVDPTTGRMYWYDAVTRRTQWDKPQEVRQMEKRKKAQRRKRDLAFFQEMEKNILRSLGHGELIPGIPTSNLEPTGPPLEPANATAIGSRNVRTLSRMDDTILAELRDDVVSPEEFNRAIQAQARTRPRSSSRGRPPLPNPSKSSTSARDRSRSRSRSGRCVVDTLDTLEAAAELEKKRVSTNSVPPLPSGRNKGQSFTSRATSTSRGEDSAGLDALAGEHLLDGPLPTETLSLSTSESSKSLSGNRNHVRRNTGGTIVTLTSTMSNPDVEATIKCVCGVYRAHMVQASEQRSFNSPVSVMGKPLDMEVFHDRYHLPPQWKQSKQQPPTDNLPSLVDIVEFYQEFYRRSQMEHDTIIMSLIYVERLIKTASVVPTPENWRSVLFSCMVLASKVWDDLSMWNIDFSNVASAHSQGLSLFTLQRVNQLESVLLKSLGFDVKVPASEYAKYYFLIRGMLMRSGLLGAAPKPFGKEDAVVLENRTSHYQDSKLGGDRHDRRSKSMYDYSWFEKSPDADGSELSRSPPDGPVLKDKICLEQLVSMSSER